MMRFLLINTNSAVKKIFTITAKKAGIQLDVVDAITQIPLDKDYSCIFIDDGALNSGDIANFKSRMITTKFCVILSKDSPLASGFDSYIRKPFLPTDIYEVLKKEKDSEINLANEAYSEDDEGEIDANSDIDLSEFTDNEDEFLSGVKDADSPSGIDFEGNPMGDSSDLGADFDLGDLDSEQSSGDLGDFGDSNDSNADDSTARGDDLGDIEIPHTHESDISASVGDSSDSKQSSDLGVEFDLGDFGNANEVQGNLGDELDLDANVGDSSATSAQDLGKDSTTDSTQDSVKSATKKPLDGGIDLDFGDSNTINADSTEKVSQDKAPKPTQTDIFEEAESQIRNIKALSDKGGNFYNSANNADDIDFSAIMALQEEILREEAEKNKKKGLIGGDISKRKDDSGASSTKENAVESSAEVAMDSTPPAVESAEIDSAKNISVELENAKTEQDSTQDSDNLTDVAEEKQDFDFTQRDEIKAQGADDLPSKDAENTQETEAQNAEEDFLEALDFANDTKAQGAQENTIDTIDLQSDSISVSDSAQESVAQESALDSIAEIEQDSTQMAQDSTRNSTAEVEEVERDSMIDSTDSTTKITPDSTHSADKYEDFSFDKLENDEFDALDGLSGISEIVSDTPPPTSAPKGTDDILSNLDIMSISEDYAATHSAGTPQTADSALSANYDFSTTFSSGINAEMDSISPNFNARNFADDESAERATQKYNMLGLPIDESGDVKDINELSENEIENLDDEALLLLQEKSLRDKAVARSVPKATKSDSSAKIAKSAFAKSAPQNAPKPTPSAPKVLDKAQIDDITNILEGTQSVESRAVGVESMESLGAESQFAHESFGTGMAGDLLGRGMAGDFAIESPQESLGVESAQEAFDARTSQDFSDDLISEATQRPRVMMSNNEFASLTQEALSEVLGEEAIKRESVANADSTAFDDDFIDDRGDSTQNTMSDSPKATHLNANQTATPPIPSQINLSDGALNITEILQTFPIDKLRELLSGVQITVNITFPTKKQ